MFVVGGLLTAGSLICCMLLIWTLLSFFFWLYSWLVLRLTQTLQHRKPKAESPKP